MSATWDRWEVLKLVQDIKRVIGLNDRDIMVLRAHLTVLPAGPLRPDQLNLSFMKVSEILSRACAMEERRFHRGEVRLEAAGLVLRRLSANGRRFPERDSSGQIIGGYGIDLRPLLSRLDELAEIRDRIEAEKLALRQKRNHVSARFQNILRELYATARELPSHVAEFKERLRNALRRKTTTLKDLERLEAEVADLEKAPYPDVGDTAVEQPTAVNSESAASPGTEEMTEETVKTGVDARQNVRQIESKLKENYKEPSPDFSVPRISCLWRSTKTLKSFYPEPPEREREAARVLFEFSSFIGLGQQVILNALSTFGWENLFIVVDYLAERTERLKHPEGYLSTMIKCFERGEPVAGGSVQPLPLPRNHAAV
ncbi:helix-turn-helix domain-containing protein [Sulfitobacter sp. M220]|uniref:helix-turn-helix domain-containing protein n=1 Tax=Sulfitobacter sp. M220 TaxID=2675333 RepID=UPI001F303DEA|nr:helix-turn-helix domain-containing protein [Sulfitobacter sp. M220]